MEGPPYSNTHPYSKDWGREAVLRVFPSQPFGAEGVGPPEPEPWGYSMTPNNVQHGPPQAVPFQPKLWDRWNCIIILLEMTWAVILVGQETTYRSLSMLDNFKGLLPCSSTQFYPPEVQKECRPSLSLPLSPRLGSSH